MSKIEWTDRTWNPVTGCTKVSPGCKHCYAERLWARLSAPGMPYVGRKFTDIQCHTARLHAPTKWRNPSMIFVNSMSDLFHADVDDEFLLLVMETIKKTPHHQYQILTKRPEIAHEFFKNNSETWGLKNIWIGVSAENQATAYRRVSKLITIPGNFGKFVSAEPLLEKIDLGSNISGIDWLIVGGESGPKARPTHVEWVRSLRDQCVEHDTPFFFKQWGEWGPESQMEIDPRNLSGSTEAVFGDYNGIKSMMYKVGKRRSRNKLDGQIWEQWPSGLQLNGDVR